MFPRVDGIEACFFYDFFYDRHGSFQIDFVVSGNGDCKAIGKTPWSCLEANEPVEMAFQDFVTGRPNCVLTQRLSTCRRAVPRCCRRDAVVV